ncbi:MAG: hypothetical protein ACLFQ6_01540 [Candidatus Sumerlaeia bacterium]
MSKKLEERFAFSGDEDLGRLIREFQAGRVAMLPSGLEEHNRIARERPADFENHPPVLAFSVGGSNTKVMLAERKDGRFIVHHVRTMPNPTTMTPLFDYLDHLILDDPIFREYMDTSEQPCLGFSIAVGITDGVPNHATKIPNIEGFVARDLKRDASTHHFGKNMAKWFESRGLKQGRLAYQGDAIIAHLGGVATAKLQDGETSFLLVCGNGLACANSRHFVLCGTNGIIHDDDRLYPAEEMEGGQYQYLVAGKGAYGLMRRAIHLKAQESDSNLKPETLDPYFATDKDTRHVYEIYESIVPGGQMKESAARIKDLVGPEAFAELQWISERIADRAINVLANCVLSTMIEMGLKSGDVPPVLFVEGSIALNPALNPRVRETIRTRARNERLYESLGVDAPPVPDFDRATDPALPGPGLSEEDAAKVELTLMGTAAMIMAESCMKK